MRINTLGQNPEKFFFYLTNRRTFCALTSTAAITSVSGMDAYKSYIHMRRIQ